ncbi:MAG: alpha-hydroxy-acid oxidizing protein [Oscillospiraceae bacterium]|nr:alpha-hydroxy-acid oxidizing protein [Oscillospiraceae bacterium]
MEYNEILAAARTQLGPYCKACPVCNGLACGNSMPGPGCKAPGNAAARNFAKWQEICVNMDTLCENRDIDMSFSLFARTFAAPVFIAPLGAVNMHYGDKYNDLSYNRLLVPACAEYGIAAFTGDGVDPEVMKSSAEDMIKVGGLGVPTIKPWNREAVFEKLDYLHAKGDFLAVAMDVDGAGLPFLKAMNPNAGSKSVAELREIIDYARMPFIVKGIMTPAGARKAAEAGAAAIVVSNHGGRVQGGVPSTAEVLPGIADAVGGSLTIFVDGGIRSGVDVYRALALGADAVLIGRPVVPFIYAAGAEGLKAYLDRLLAELSSTMTMCGTPTLADIGRENVRIPW